MDAKQYTILLAEDEESSRFLYYEELSEEGYRVLTAENGFHVLGTLEDQKVDLLMTDVKMPDMHALEMIPRVREEHPDLPIIVVSAFRGLENEFGITGFNIESFFVKPVDMNAVKEKIREVLSSCEPKNRSR